MKKKSKKLNNNKVSKKKYIIKTTLMLVALFLVVGTGLYFYGRMNRKKDEPVNVSKVENTIEKYGYAINDNASDYYKSEFEILKELAKNDDATEEDIVKQVAKLYIIDLLSLQEKINKYEVTCSQYFYSDKRNMNTQKIIDNF